MCVIDLSIIYAVRYSCYVLSWITQQNWKHPMELRLKNRRIRNESHKVQALIKTNEKVRHTT